MGMEWHLQLHIAHYTLNKVDVSLYFVVNCTYTNYKCTRAREDKSKNIDWRRGPIDTFAYCVKM
jgi:hypothetical protein